MRRLSARQLAAIAAKNEERDQVREGERLAKAAAMLFGWCSYCGEDINIEAGKLHDRWCEACPREHRHARPDEVAA